MEKLQYEKQDFNQGRDCAGLIVLQTDEVVEHEVRHWLTNDITLYHTRIPSQPVVTQDTLMEMREHIPIVCKLFPNHAPLSVIAYCCTSGSTLIGESVVEQSIRSVFPNAKATNPLTAVKAKLNSINVKKLGLLTPYIPSVTKAMSEHLLDNGFSIVSSGSFYEESESEVCRISEKSITQAIEHIASADQCEAIFASCTNLRTLGILDNISKKLGIPVISSNSALAWHIEQLSTV